MQTFYMTDAGKVRTHNEDNVIISTVFMIEIFII